MSAHSTMMGSQYRDNQSVAAMSRKEGSMYSGRASNFNRGKQTRFNLLANNNNKNKTRSTFQLPTTMTTITTTFRTTTTLNHKINNNNNNS
jgi:hypothetical protein